MGDRSPSSTSRTRWARRSDRGRAAIVEFYRGTIATGAKFALDGPVRGSHGSAAAMAFTATIGPVTARVIDVMTFDEAGRFTGMRAYFAPDDIAQSDH